MLNAGLRDRYRDSQRAWEAAERKAAAAALAAAAAKSKAKEEEKDRAKEEEEDKAVVTGMAMNGRDDAEYIATELMTPTAASAGGVAGGGEVMGDKGKEGDRVTPLDGIGAATATPKNRNKRLLRSGLLN